MMPDAHGAFQTDLEVLPDEDDLTAEEDLLPLA